MSELVQCNHYLVVWFCRIWNSYLSYAVVTTLVQTTTIPLVIIHHALWDVAPTGFYQGFYGTWQLFLEGYKAFRYGLKHSFRPTVCMNYTVVHEYMINTEFYLTLSKYTDKLLVVMSLALKQISSQPNKQPS